MIVALNVAAIAILLTVPSPPRLHQITRAWRDELRAGIAMLPRHRPLVSILGVTVVVNLFYFTFIALVPEMAEDLGVSAFATGALSGASTIGATISAAAIASLPHPARGRIYVLGSLLALVALPVFALAGSYSLALVALIVSGLGLGGFATMQMTLITTVVPRDERGRALGLMSTAIGVLPVGTILLGLVAEPIGIGPAIAGSAGLGALLLVLWLLRWPEAFRLP